MPEMKTVVLPGVTGEHTFRLHTRNLGEILSPAPISCQAELTALVQRALAHPLGCPALAGRVQSGQRILVVVDDITRDTPTRAIIPVLLDYLQHAGAGEGDIRFALALGTHRPMTEPEIVHKLGEGVARRFEVINTPAQQQEAFVATGEAWGGVPIEVHRAVVEADVVIGIGSVVPHADAGWSGGCKIVLPGMCSERTVMENHILAAAFPGNLLGQTSTGIRENMEAIVEKIGLDYSINVVMTPYGQVVDLLGGHFVRAQRAAVAVSRRIYSVPFKEKTDIVVSNAYPGEIDLWQGSKGIWAAEMMVKNGGTVILNAPCYEGVGPHPEYLELMARRREEILQDIRDGYLQDKNVAGSACQIAWMLERMHLVIVSPELAQEGVKSDRISLFSSLQPALDATLNGVGPNARVGVITHGGYTYPVWQRDLTRKR
jgi:nickel-dependent lactate racemase